MPKHLKKLSEEIIHTNPWWTCKHDVYEMPNGETGDYYYGETPGNAMIIPVLADDKIALILQFRYLQQKESIEFPCGGIRDGEAPIDTAKRELLQETGYEATDFIKIGTFQALNGMVLDECHLFLAEATEQRAQSPDASEEIEVIYRRPDEVEQMVQRNEIWDGQTLAAWAIARSHFFKQ